MAELGRAEVEGLLDSTDPDQSPEEALVFADYFLERGDQSLAAAALDRAFGLAPEDPEIARHRALLLDGLALEELGLGFRYVPAGSFLMGSDDGDPDERPVHPVRLDPFWMAEVPISWAAYCDLMGWSRPPGGFPPEGTLESERQGFFLYEENKIRLQYCESETLRARDWHAHLPGNAAQAGRSLQEMFGPVERRGDARPLGFDEKPMVAVSWIDAELLCAQISTETVRYRLPSEAQWERAARGGLIGKRYPWGDAPPSPELCDFDHFETFSIGLPRESPPNGYGLHAMTGGVWEWTRDDYDALAYRPDAPRPPPGQARERALRGGSWADCAAAVTVSFRASSTAGSWRQETLGGHLTPTIGFRLVREEVPSR